MKQVLDAITIILLFYTVVSCTEINKSKEMPPPLFTQPNTVAVNIEEGYAVNQVTGDSLKPIANSFEDTVLTGVPIPISNWLKREIPFPVDAARQSSLCAQFALPFATGMVCLKQFKAMEMKYGAFTPVNLTHKELL